MLLPLLSNLVKVMKRPMGDLGVEKGELVVSNAAVVELACGISMATWKGARTLADDDDDDDDLPLAAAAATALRCWLVASCCSKLVDPTPTPQKSTLGGICGLSAASCCCKFLPTAAVVVAAANDGSIVDAADEGDGEGLRVRVSSPSPSCAATVSASAVDGFLVEAAGSSG
jgi:hypothetical protein